MAAWSFYVNDYPAPVEGAREAAKLDDTWFQKLLKLFPTEIVTFYTAADTLARTANDQTQWIATTAVAVFFLALIPQAFQRVRDVSWKTKKGKEQIMIGMGAYAIWTYATGGWPTATNLYFPIVSGLVVVGFWAIVFLYGPKTTTRGR